MSNNTEVTDTTQRIVEAMARSESEIYDSIGEENLFNPEKHTIVGEVPIHLRKLHNLLDEVGNEATLALTQANELKDALQKKIMSIVETVGGLGNMPKAEPEEIKLLRLETEAASLVFDNLRKQNEIVHSLFFNSLHEHFPILTAKESDFSGSSVVTGWQVAGNRAEDSTLADLLGALFGGGRIQVVGVAMN